MKPPVLNAPHLKFPSFIILEGPDAAGKTTLATSIAHRLKAVVLHGASMGDSDLRPDNDDVMRRYHCNLLEIATRNLALGHPVVCDRLWLSHIIYARARRDGMHPNLDLVAYEEDFYAACKSLGAFTIFALDEACIQNAQKHQDPDHPRDVSAMETLFHEYSKEQWYWDQKARACALYRYTTDGKDIPRYLEKLQTMHNAIHK